MSKRIDNNLLKRYEELGASDKVLEKYNKRIKKESPNEVALKGIKTTQESLKAIKNVDSSHIDLENKNISSKSFGVKINKEKTIEKNKKGLKYKAKKGLLIGAISVAVALGIKTLPSIHIPRTSDNTEVTQEDTSKTHDTTENIIETDQKQEENLIEENTKEKQSPYIISNPESTSKMVIEDGNSKFLLQNAKSIFIDNYNNRTGENLDNISIIKEQINIASSIDENGVTHYFHADRDYDRYTNDDDYTVLSGSRYLVFKGDNPYDENGNYRQDLFIGETTLDGSSFDDSNSKDTIATEELSKLAKSDILDLSFDFYNNFDTNKAGSGVYSLIVAYNNAVENYEKMYSQEEIATESIHSEIIEDSYEIDL